MNKRVIISGVAVILVLFVVAMVYLYVGRADDVLNTKSEEAIPTMAPEKVDPEIKPAENKIEEVTPKKTDFDEMFTPLNDISGNIQWKYKIYGTDIEGGSGEGAVHSASVIKIFIMEYAYKLLAENEIDFNEQVAYDTLRNHIEKMIIYSDNDATNVLIDYFGMEKLNNFMAESGYKDSVIRRKMLDETSRKNGIDNFTSAEDVFKFLDKLYENKDVFPYNEMLEIMKNNHGKGKIADMIPEDVDVANKPGENDDIDNDVGIIFTDKGDVAVAIFCTDITDKMTAQSLITYIGERIYNYMK